MATCDIRITKKGEEIIERWFDKDGIISKNLGDDVGSFFKQFWESSLDKNFDSTDTPSLAQLRHLEKRVIKLEKGFQKKTGKIAEMFYLPEEVVKNNYQAHKTFKSFKREHNYFEGKRDDYQKTMLNIVSMIGEKAKVLGLMKKGNIREVKKAHKKLQGLYNQYQQIILNEGWGPAEEFYQRNLAELSKDTQFQVFELVDDVLRDPSLVTSKDKATREKYGIFADIVSKEFGWQKISKPLFNDLKSGLKYYVSALSEANRITNGKYTDIQGSIQKILDNLHYEKNYFPTEVLNIMPTMRVVQESIYDRSKSSDTDFNKLADYVKNIAEVTIEELRLSPYSREKKSMDRVRRNKDVISVMDNYIRNVTMFNFSGITTDSLLKGVRRINELQGGEQEQQAIFYSKYLYDNHAALLGLNINSSFKRTMVRAITSWEFMSKLGLNIRGALRNATQSLQNIVYFGVSGTVQSMSYLSGELGVIAKREAQRHGAYFASAREMTNTLSLFPEVAESTTPKGKTVLTYKADSASQKFTRGLESFAMKTGAPMRFVENKVNRNLTFLIGFAMRHKQLSNNAGIMSAQIKEAADSKKLQIERREKESESDAIRRMVGEEIVKRSSYFAANVVRELHYEYSPFGKPKIMRGPAASVAFQFMTYGVNFWNYQYKIASRGGDAILAGDWRSKEAWRLYRLGMLYFFINGILSPASNSDVGNLVQHDTYERLENFTNFLSSDPAKKKRAFFGKGPLIGTVGGPFVSDLITFGNMAGFYDLLTNKEMDERSALGYLAGYQDYSSTKGSEKLFDFVRTLNTQVGRSLFVTAPRMWNGAGIGTLLEIEFGVFKNKKMQEKKMKYFYPVLKHLGVEKPTFAERKRRTKEVVPKKQDLVLKSLESLGKASRQFT